MLEYAIRCANEIPYRRKEYRHYAVLTDKRGKIISESANSYTRTHTIMYRASRKVGLVKDYLHCEVACLIKDKDRRGVKLTVVRVDAKGNACYSEPCTVCKEVLKMFPNIKSIEYSTGS